MAVLGKGIRRKLLLTYLAIAIPLLFVIVYTNYNHYEQNRQDVVDARRAHANDVAISVERFANDVSSTERAIGIAIIEKDFNRRDASDYLARIGKRFPVLSLDYVRPSGEIYASSDPKLVGTELIRGNFDLSSSAKYLNQERDWFVSQMHQHDDGGVGFDIVTALFGKNGKISGMVVASIDANRLDEVLSAPAGGINITDRDGRLIYQDQNNNVSWDERDWSQAPFVKTALSGREFVAESIEFPIDDSNRVGVQVPIKSLSWTAGSFARTSVAISPIRSEFMVSLAIAFLAFLIAALFGLWMAGMLTRPISLLTGKAQAVAGGNYNEPGVQIKRDDEIGEIARSFDLMRLRLNDYVTELQDLVDTGEKMNIALNIPLVENAITAALQKSFDARAVWLMLYKDDQKLLVMDYFWGSEEFDLSSLVLAPGKGIAGKVIMTGKPVIVDDLSGSDCEFDDIMKRAGIDSFIMLPLLSGGGALGVIGIHTPLIKRQQITEKEMSLMMALANQAAVAIENARLYEESHANELKYKASNDDLRILNKVAIDISAGLDLTELVARLEKNAVDLISASIGSIGLFDPDDGRLKYHHYLTGNGKPLEDADIPDDLGLAELAIKLRRTTYTNDYRKDSRAHKAAKEYGITSVMVVPMFVKDTVIGVIQVANVNAKPFKESDIGLLEAMANQAAVAIENARLYQREQFAADTLQNMLLEVPETLGGVNVGVKYRSSTEQGTVGGDFYDFIEFANGNIGIVIGDVAGKGLEAATATTMAKMTVRAFARENSSPAEVLAKANQAMASDDSQNQFITMLYAVLNPGTGVLQYANGGHPAPIIVDYVTGSVRQFEIGAAALGVMESTLYENHTDKLDIAEALILYTDGLLAARKDNEFFGEERIAKALISVGDPDVNIIPERLLETAQEFTGGSLKDDVAVVVISRKAPVKTDAAEIPAAAEKPAKTGKKRKAKAAKSPDDKFASPDEIVAETALAESELNEPAIKEVAAEPDSAASISEFSKRDESPQEESYFGLEELLYDGNASAEPEIVLDEKDVSVDDLNAEVNRLLALAGESPALDSDELDRIKGAGAEKPALGIVDDVGQEATDQDAIIVEPTEDAIGKANSTDEPDEAAPAKAKAKKKRTKPTSAKATDDAGKSDKPDKDEKRKTGKAG